MYTMQFRQRKSLHSILALYFEEEKIYVIGAILFTEFTDLHIFSFDRLFLFIPNYGHPNMHNCNPCKRT